MGAWRGKVSRRCAWLGAGLLSVVLILLLASRGEPGRSVRLADGSRLTFHGVSIGSQVSRFFGSFASRLAQTLPAPVQRGFPRGMVVRYVYQETNFVLWLHQDRIPAPDQRIRFSLSDDQGTSVALQVAPSIQPLPSGGAAITLPMTVWPRAARRMVLSVFDERLETPTQLAAQWTFENPAPGSRVSWPAPVELPPVSQRLGDVFLTLERFEVRPMPAMLWRLSRTNVKERLGFLEFSCTNAAGAGVAAPPWRLAAVRLWDATGNERGWTRIDPKAARHDGGDRIRVSMLKLPWPSESAYQIETLWRPSNPGASHELIRIRDIALPTTPSSARSVGGGSWSGGEFRLYASTSPDSAAPGWRLYALMLSAAPDLQPRHDVSLVEGVDQRDRRWVADERGELTVPGDLVEDFRSNNVTTVSVTIDARRLKLVTFTAQPVRRTSSLPTPGR